MHADKPNPDTPSANEELTGALKRAVDQVKGQQPPLDSVAKSVEQANGLAEQTIRKINHLAIQRLQPAIALCVTLECRRELRAGLQLDDHAGRVRRIVCLRTDRQLMIQPVVLDVRVRRPGSRARRLLLMPRIARGREGVRREAEH